MSDGTRQHLDSACYVLFSRLYHLIIATDWVCRLLLVLKFVVMFHFLTRLRNSCFPKFSERAQRRKRDPRV